MTYITLNLSGPLMAWAGPRIDEKPMASPIPTASHITGMIGAALGIRRSDADTLQHLQDSLRTAVVIQSAGKELVDYQIARLTTPHMRGPAPMDAGVVMDRRGGPDTRTRQTLYPYRTDARMVVVIELDDARSPFTAEEIVAAIETPTWTLRLGRAGCPPDEPIVANAVQASSLAEAAAGIEGALVYLPVDATDPQLGDVYQPIYGRRDWRANRHGGEEIYVVRAA
jgi:CRISPR system Cascade subunit CasD